jgi:hypothetical protein
MPQRFKDLDTNIQRLCVKLGRFKRLKKIHLVKGFSDAVGRMFVEALKGSSSVTWITLVS